MTAALTALISLTGLCICVMSLRQLLLTQRLGENLPLPHLTLASASLVNQSWFSSRALILTTGTLTICVCVFSIARAWSRVGNASIKGRQFMFVALPLWLFAVDALANPDVSLVSTLGRLLPALVFVSILPLCSPGSFTMKQGAYIVLFGFGLSCALAYVAAAPWTACSTFKCGVFGQLFAGPFPSENYLGAVATLAFLAALVVPTRSLRFVTILAAVAILVASNARTSQLGLILALAVYTATRLVQIRTGAGKHLLAWGMAGGFLSLGLGLIYTAEPSDFSNRGSIWRLGTRAVGDAWPVGRGLSSWSSDVLARNYMHSQALLLLFAGGVLALAMYGLIMARAVTVCGPRHLPYALALSALVLIRGLTEIVWNPLALDGTTFLMLPVLYLISVGSERSLPLVPQQSLAPNPH